MGPLQSKNQPSEHALPERLNERLRALELEKSKREPIEDEKIPQYSPSSSFPRLSIAAAERWQEELQKDPKNRLAISAFTVNNAANIIRSRSTTITNTQVFNVKVPLEGSPVTNQKSSGRCWLFAATNVFRVAFMKTYNLEEFQLSQAYLFFWDKLEKSNYFFESIIETVNEPLSGRLLQTLLEGPVSDGGQWDSKFTNL